MLGRRLYLATNRRFAVMYGGDYVWKENWRSSSMFPLFSASDIQSILDEVRVADLCIGVESATRRHELRSEGVVWCEQVIRPTDSLLGPDIDTVLH